MVPVQSGHIECFNGVMGVRMECEYRCVPIAEQETRFALHPLHLRQTPDLV